MRQASLVDDVAYSLHLDPAVRTTVGERVRTDKSTVDLPDVVVTGISDATGAGTFSKIVLTCRGNTSVEADQVGSAVKLVLDRGDGVAGRRWVTVQDKSGYDSAARAFRRVILVEPSS